MLFDTPSGKAKLWPAVVALLAVTVVTLFIAPSTISVYMEEGGGIEAMRVSLEQSGLAVTDELIDGMMLLVAFVMSIGACFAYPLAASASGAGFALLVCRPALGIKVNYRQVFAVYLYAAIIPVLGFVVSFVTTFTVPSPMGISLARIIGAVFCGVCLYTALSKASGGIENQSDTDSFVKKGVGIKPVAGALVSVIITYFWLDFFGKAFEAAMAPFVQQAVNQI